MAKKESLVKKHAVHQYVRVMDGERPIYRCILPGCSHFIGEALILNKVSLCNRCGEEFIIGKSMIQPRRIVKPHCDRCSRPVYNRKTGLVQKGRGQLKLIPQADGTVRKVVEPEISLDFVDQFLKDVLK